MAGELVPQTPAESSRPIAKEEKLLAKIDDLKRENKRLKAQAGVPVLKAIKNEIIERAKSGKLAKEIKGRKFGSLVRDLKEVVALLEDKVPGVLIAVPQAPASEGKDVGYYKKNTPSNLTDYERKKRREIIEAEVEKNG